MSYIKLVSLSIFCWFFLSSHGFASHNVICDHAAKTMDQQAIGGKGMNLFLLQQIPGMKVPNWFSVSSEAFSNYIQENKIDTLLKQLDECCTNESDIPALGIKIQNAILNGNLSSKLHSDILQAYTTLSGEKETSVSVRSSGVLEDGAHSSLAGQYDTYLNQVGIENVCTAIKKVWASSFNERVLLARCQANMPQTECRMAVIVQKMVRVRTAGVAASLEISSNYPGIEISSNYGTGESTVGGEQSVDKWLVHASKPYIIKSVLGKKERYFELAENGQGTIEQNTKGNEQHKWSLELNEVLLVAENVKKIAAYYNNEVDTEFAFDMDGTLYFLQARPLVRPPETALFVVDAEDARHHTIIASGDYSIPGVVSGRLKIIETWEDLANKKVEINSEDIVMTYVAINYWSHYLTQFRGLITKQGGPTSHPMLLCRERKVPCLIGIGNDFEKLRQYSGKIVTLDGIGRKIYEGEVATKKVTSSEIMKAFEPVTVRKWKPFDERIFELQKGNYVREQDDKFWLTEPTYPSKKLFQNIFLSRARRLPGLIQGHSNCTFEMRVIDSYVCSLLEPAEKYVSPFNTMTLAECETFCQNYEKRALEFVNLAKKFQLDQPNWQSYVEAISDLYAYAWVSEIFRMYVDRETEKLAHALQVPQYYFDECASSIQSELEEEDTCLQNEMYTLAQKMQKLPAYKSVSEIQINDSESYQELVQLATKYRFSSNCAIENDPDLTVVYKKIQDEIKLIQNGKKLSTTKKAATTSYFPQHQDLYKWMYVSLRNRVVQSNTHHYLMRYQWKVREELLRLGTYWTAQGTLKHPKDIFNLSPNEITTLITKRKEPEV